MWVAKVRIPHPTTQKAGNPVAGGGAVIKKKKRAISREHGRTLYTFETWDCDAEGHYLDKLKKLR